MTDEQLQQRISQWEKMTSDDPENAMGWFSLGNAYKDADRTEEAARSMRKAIELDPGLSRAYQVLGQILVKAGEQDRAKEILTTGYKTAAERGDVMPMRAMGSLLEKIGAEVPDVETKETPVAVDPDAETIVDRRTGQEGPRLPDPPMRGPIGKFIYDHYTAPTWREWIAMGTKVINELRLDFSKPEHQDMYDQHMMEWLGFTEEEAKQYAESAENE